LPLLMGDTVIRPADRSILHGRTVAKSPGANLQPIVLWRTVQCSLAHVGKGAWPHTALWATFDQTSELPTMDVL
jgi:hypothetical protein